MLCLMIVCRAVSAVGIERKIRECKRPEARRFAVRVTQGTNAACECRAAADRTPFLVLAVIALLSLATLAGCDVERRRSDAELGLNPQQVAGRQIYDNYCDRCHRPYSTKGRKGPGLKGVFQHPYLSVSGLPANDDRVSEIIRYGRHEMPGYSQTLSADDLRALLAYLHTL
jgi:mono/diheme cytochrome c family protein